MSIVPTPESDRVRSWAKVDKDGPVPEAYPEIAREHDMSKTSVWRIVRRLAYPDVE